MNSGGMNHEVWSNASSLAEAFTRARLADHAGPSADAPTFSARATQLASLVDDVLDGAQDQFRWLSDRLQKIRTEQGVAAEVHLLSMLRRFNRMQAATEALQAVGLEYDVLMEKLEADDANSDVQDQLYSLAKEHKRLLHTITGSGDDLDRSMDEDLSRLREELFPGC